MSYDKKYQYHFFFLKPEYADLIPMYSFTKEYPYLFGYTDRKDNARGFMKIHNSKMFIYKKLDISRDEVNILASKFQNGIIRKEKMRGKNNHCESVEAKLCITEREYNLTENACYQSMDSVYNCLWDIDLSLIRHKYAAALERLRFTYFQEKLERGNCDIITGIEADLINTFIGIFKPILEVSYEDL